MISIIIPVLNESENILKLLDHLYQNTAASKVKEVIVVDGGSTDGTLELVVQFSDANRSSVRLITSEKGRAKQMNAGAAQATGNILYFLHADSFPPKEFDRYINESVLQGADAGSFRMKFDSNHPVLKVSQWFTKFNYKFCRGGDQSLFIKKEVFEQLQGYQESYIIYEDCEFINRIYDGYKFKVINAYLTTSARRYRKNGTAKLQYHFTIIHLKKLLGASPEKLSNYYHKHIAS